MESFRFKKKYGQNFLNDQNIIKKIVDSISPNSDDLIIEIGPGAGALTKELVKKNANLIAFEIDKETSKYLSKFESEKTKIVYEDFLNVNLQEYINKDLYSKIYVIGNLPYYITTPILEKIIEQPLDVESITVMVQKEVANRFSAKPGTKDYGYMTVLLNYNYSIHKIIDVKRTCFKPVPNVDSAVVQLVNKRESNKTNYDTLKSVLKESFQFKRKMLLNNIKSIDKDSVLSVLSKHGYDETVRAEELDLDTFIDLSKLMRWKDVKKGEH